MSGVGSHGEIIVVQKHRRDGVREVACVELLLYPAELRRRDQAGAAETLAAETLAVWRSLPVRNRVKPGLRRPRGRQPPPLRRQPPFAPKLRSPAPSQWAVSWPKSRVVAASGWRRAAKRAAAGCLRDQHDLERCARAVRRPGPPPRAGQGAERAPSPPSASEQNRVLRIICPCRRTSPSQSAACRATSRRRRAAARHKARSQGLGSMRRGGTDGKFDLEIISIRAIKR